MASSQQRRRWLRTTEVAERLGISQQAVRLGCASGRWRCRRVGARWRVAASDVERYLEDVERVDGGG